MEANLNEIINDQTNRWLFVGGKGGVGKTTTSCAIAVKIAKTNPNKNFLLISTDPAHNTSDTFNQKFTHEPSPVEGLPNLSVMEVDAQKQAEDNKKSSSLDKLCSSMPGMDEAMAYATIIKLVNEKNFDRIIFDTAPTGHTLRLLDFPNVVAKALNKFQPLIDMVKPMVPMMNNMMKNMAKGNAELAENFGITDDMDLEDLFKQIDEYKPLIDQIQTEFKDPEKTNFICVCIAEFLSLYETERLIQRLMELEIDSQNIVINQLMPSSGDSDQDLELFFKFRSKLQNKYLQKYDQLYGEDFFMVQMPLMDHEIRGIDKLVPFSEMLHNKYDEDVMRSLKEPILDNKELKWVFVGGKGGVGKTTSSCSLALQLAKTRKNVLLISTDPAHNTSDAFNQKFTKEPTKVEGVENLSCMEITPDFNIGNFSDSALEDPNQEGGGFMGMSKKFMKDLLACSPGIDEAMAYYEIWRLVEKLNYDCVIFDTAPTGHTLRLLNFPTIMENALEQVKQMKDSLGGLSDMGSLLGGGAGKDMNPLDLDAIYEKMKSFMPAIRKIRDEFKNPEQTTFVAVCIAEFLSLYETERLIQELCELEIDCGALIINQLVTESKQKENLMKFRRKIQDKYLSQYDDLYGEDFHLVKVPLVDDEIRGVDKLFKFSGNLV